MMPRKKLQLRALIIKPRGLPPAVILAPRPCIGCGLVHGHVPGCGLDFGAPEMNRFTAGGVAVAERLS